MHQFMLCINSHIDDNENIYVHACAKLIIPAVIIREAELFYFM